MPHEWRMTRTPRPFAEPVQYDHGIFLNVLDKRTPQYA